MRLFDRFRRAEAATSPMGDDVGPEIVDFLYRSMAIDERWSIREPRGFAWWGHKLAQRVWAEPARESRGVSIVRVHAETALLREVPGGLETSKKIAAFNRFASLSALVWNREQGRAALHCAMTLHRENSQWAQSLLLAAVGLQAADAHIKLALAQAFGARPDVSQHPVSGERNDPDEMLDMIRTVFAPQGQGPSPFTEKDFQSTLSMNPRPWVLATGGHGGLTAEFPFTGSRPAAQLAMQNRHAPIETSILMVSATDRHPQMGSGALLRLALPIQATEDEAAEMAATLNRAEMAEGSEGLSLGAWCTDPQLGVCFVTFLPAATYKEGLLGMLVLGSALRARWAVGQVGSP
jgi:hypothetical protein